MRVIHHTWGDRGLHARAGASMCPATTIFFTTTGEIKIMTDVPALTVELNGPQWLTIRQDIPCTGPENLLRWFLDPDLLTRWWSQDATVEPIVGGRWTIAWPSLERVLDGQIAAISATSLVVSWVWTHEPELPARALIVRAEPAADGATLGILQGPYRQSRDFPGEDEDRAAHVEGWEYFLPRLVAAIVSARH